MAKGGESSFLTRRWEAFLDNLIWWVAVTGIGAVGATAFLGTDLDSLPLWLVVLFGGIQAGCVAALVALFRRRPRSATTAIAFEAPHPHRKLLARIDALDKSLSELDPTYPASWPPARAFNGILEEARQESDDLALRQMEPLERGSDDFDDLARDANNGTVRTLLGQIRSIVA